VTNADTWRHVIQVRQRLKLEDSRTEGAISDQVRPNYGGNCAAREITDVIIVTTMTNCMGPILAVDMLIEFYGLGTATQDQIDPATQPDLPLSVFKYMVIQGQRISQQKGIVHQALEVVDGYLWTQKTPLMGPQFRAVEALEHQDQRFEDRVHLPFAKQRGGIHTSSDHAGSPSFADASVRQHAELNFDYTTCTPRFFEDMNSHWGVYTSFSSSCERTQMPLTEPVGPTVVVFPSGNAYHEASIPEGACVVSMMQNFTSLIDD